MIGLRRSWMPFGLLSSLLLPAIVGFIVLLAAALGKRIGRKTCGIVSFLTLMASTILLVSASSEALSRGLPTREVYGVRLLTLYGAFDLYADWLSLPLAIAIVFLSSLSALYSISYMESLELVHVEPEMMKYSIAYQKGLANPQFIPDREAGTVPSIETYFANLLLFATCMLGVVLSTNLVQLFIFFELVIIPTFFLIYIWGSGPCRLIAIKYFMYMFAGGAAMLAAIVWTYASVNSLDLQALPTLLANVDIVSATGIALLFFIGFGVKAAIVPFHTWLPDFHAEAPVPIHALLSAVLIKLGIYGIVRIVYPSFPLLMSGEGVRLLLLSLSLITMLWGAAMALMQIQIKRILAYSSVNQIGYIMLGLASGTDLGVTGALFHVVTHGLAKGMLLLCAGSIIHQSHVRDVDKLGGLARNMPITAAVTLLGGLSIAGTPPLAGFASEWMIFTGVIQAGYLPLAMLGLLSTSLTMGYYLWAIRRIFFQERKPEFEKVHESPAAMTIPMSVESLLLVLLGVYPQLLLPLIHPASVQLVQLLGGI